MDGSWGIAAGAAAVMVLVWIAAFVLRRRAWREPRAGSAAAVRVGVLAGAELIGHPQAGIPALVDAAVASGAATLTEEPGSTPPKLRLVLVDASRLVDDGDRDALVRIVDGSEVLLDRGDERLAARLLATQIDAAVSLRRRGLVTGPRSAASVALVVATIVAMLGAVAVIVGPMVDVPTDVAAVILAVVVVVAGGLSFRFSRMPERLTARGVATREQLLQAPAAPALPDGVAATLAPFGHAVAGARANGPIVLPGMVTPNGLWSGSVAYDTIGRLR
jgi:hypothetical protein